MHPRVSAPIKTCLQATGYYARRLRRDAFPGVLVLCYHGVRDDAWPAGSMPFEDLHVRARELEGQCRLLRECCDPISLAQWREARAGGRPLPARPVLVTFDDGYRTVFDLARPTLERHAIPAVVFVCSELVEDQRLPWYDAVARAAGEDEVMRAKRLPYADWQALRRRYERRARPGDPDAPLTVEQVRKLARVPGVEVGSHTASHPILARAGRDEQREQIVRDKARLEEWTGRPVTAFAYPNGEPGDDYTHETVGLVREAGFDAAFTTRRGFAGPADSPWELPRFLMLAGVSAGELAHRLCYSWRK